MEQDFLLDYDKDTLADCMADLDYSERMYIAEHNKVEV